MHPNLLKVPGLLCAALAFSGAAVSCSDDDGPNPGHEARDVGTVTVALKTPDGQTISSVNYVVTNAAGVVVVSDVLDVRSPYATVSVEISLPAGAGYSITMTATTAEGSHCTGTATFAVIAGETVPVALTLVCGGDGNGEEGNGHVVVDATVVSGGGGKLPGDLDGDGRTADGRRR